MKAALPVSTGVAGCRVGVNAIAQAQTASTLTALPSLVSRTTTKTTSTASKTKMNTTDQFAYCASCRDFHQFQGDDFEYILCPGVPPDTFYSLPYKRFTQPECERLRATSPHLFKQTTRPKLDLL